MGKKQTLVQEKNGDLKITIPQHVKFAKTMLLLFGGISIFSFVLLFSFGMISLPLYLTIIFNLTSAVLIYFVLREVVWQFTGKTVISLIKNDFIMEKISPLKREKVCYHTDDLILFDNEIIPTPSGNFCLLHLLHLNKEEGLAKAYNYGTLAQLSGSEEKKVAEMVRLLNQKINSRVTIPKTAFAI